MSPANQPDLEDYLQLSMTELLDAYGAGSHVPGSGSAAALSALIAVELLKTVCKLTLQKPQYVDKHKEFEFILERLELVFKPRLVELFHEDIKVFNQVSLNRRLRDNAFSSSERANHSRLALKHQKRATIIPLEICKLALQLLPLAFVVFDHGFRSARGDSGVAISNLLSAMSGSLFIVFLNLKSYRKGKWLTETMREAEGLAVQFTDSQKNAFLKVIELYREGLIKGETQRLSGLLGELDSQ